MKNILYILILCIVIVGMFFFSMFPVYEEWDESQTIVHDNIGGTIFVWECLFVLNGVLSLVFMLLHKKVFGYIYLGLAVVSLVKLISLIVVVMSHPVIRDISDHYY